MKQLHILITSLFIFSVSVLHSQNVGIGTDTPDPSAVLDITSNNSGVLIPRMSASSRQSINNPALGLMVFDSTSNAFYYFNGNGWLELLSGSVKMLTDADNDTKIQVEETADEDIIRFDIAGTEQWKMTGARLEPLNTGNSVFIGENAGLNDDLSNNTNVFIGKSAGMSNTIGDANIAIGEQSLEDNTAGSSNTAIGDGSIFKNIDGDNNTAIGRFSLSKNTSGDNNTAIGVNSLSKNTTGSDNTALGYNAGVDSGNLSNTTAIGYTAKVATSNSLVLGGNMANGTAVNVGIGTEAPTELLTLTGVSGTDGILFPDSTLQTTAFTGTELTDADNDTKIQVEKTADDDVIRFDIGGTEYFRMDTARLEIINSGRSVFIGQSAGRNDDLSNNDNVFVGHESGRVNTTGNRNTASGARSFRSNITGSANVASGYESLRSNTGSSNTGVGAWALSSNSSGENNASFGRGANSANTIGNNNLAIGSYALGSNASGSNNVAIGNGALDFISGGPVKNTAIGYEAGFNANGSNNVFIGHQAGKNKAVSDRLYIDNSSTATPLIYGEFDNDLLRVNGTLNINSAYSLPDADGTAGQVLVTDGAGNLSWGVRSNPVGTIQMWPTATPPAGWLICDGSTFSAATYPALNTVLGGTQVPNFEGRFPLGAKPIPVPQGETSFPLNSTGGEEKHILTVAEMPSHSHGIQYREGSESGSNNNYSDLGDTGVNDSTQNTGGGQAHNNMPPYLAIHFMIKAK